MVDSSDSSDSNLDRFEIRNYKKPLPLSLLNHDDDDVSGTKAMLRRRKQRKKKMTLVYYSTSTSKMTWTKHNELIILRGIVEYENEKGLSYKSDWDVFYGYIKGLIETRFSLKQLKDKVRKLKKRFQDNSARFNDEKGLSFTNSDDEEVFKLSMIIWAQNVEQVKNVPCVEHELVMEIDDNGEKEKKKSDEEDGLDEVSYLKMEIDDNGEKEKKKNEEEEDGVDEFCVLQEALEGMTLFQDLSKYQQNLLFQNLKKLEAQRRRELIDEWKTLLDEEMQLASKKLTFSAKLANAAV